MSWVLLRICFYSQVLHNMMVYIIYCWHALYHTIQFFKRIFHWRFYTKNLKRNYLGNTFEKICWLLVSSNKPLLIITWYWHTFTFALSQTMYLFHVNLNLLANVSTPASCLHCWFTVLTERNTYAILCKHGDVCWQIHGESSLQWLHLQA